MYNRYVPNGTSYTRIPVEDEPESRPRPEPLTQTPEEEHAPEKPADRPQSAGQPPATGPAQGQTGLGALGSLLEQNPLGQLFKKGTDLGGMNGILKALHLEDLDSGDILLLLILLFLFLEGDNIELVITLGLILLLGLGDEKKDQPT